MKKRISREELLAYEDLNTWSQVDKTFMSEKDRELFSKREAVVFAYFAGKPIKEITTDYGYSKQFIYTMLQRCLEPHKDGIKWGFRALIPHIHQVDYLRIAPIRPNHAGKGTAGALSRLLDRHTDIREEIETYLFKKKTENNLVHESRIRYGTIHTHFIKACRAKGIKGDEYPFNTKFMGYRGFQKHLKALEETKYMETAKARYGKDAHRALKIGGPEEPLNPATRPYMRVEFDGHNIDIVCTVQILNPFGGYTETTIDRIWLLTIKDTVSGTVIGYHLSFGREYNQFDVHECFKKALRPWERRELTIPGLKYPEDGGFPSEKFRELEWATFQEFLYDNARANISKESTRILVDITGCHVNAGPVGFPQHRAMVERFYGLLEENGFHRLPSTKGSNPSDVRRQNPEKQALKYKITSEHIEDLVEVLIAEYNGTRSLTTNRSPLERLEYFLNTKPVISKIHENKRDLSMLNRRFVRTVRGNMKKGRRPHITVQNVVYTSDILASSPALIGKKLSLYIDPKDPKCGTAYLLDGTQLGVLTAKGIWGRTPHTLEMRQQINREAPAARLRDNLEKPEIVSDYIKGLSGKSEKSKKAKSDLVRIQKTSKEVEAEFIKKQLEKNTKQLELIETEKIEPEIFNVKALIY